MRVARLSLHDFRSYRELDLEFPAGAVSLVAGNGVGKTNVVEALWFLTVLGSHRVSADLPLVRMGEDSAVIRAVVQRGERQAIIEVKIAARGANAARVNRTPVRTREILGILSSVIFAPEDLALVKGDPADRRRFLDTLLVSRTPRLAGVIADQERNLRQRNSLLKSARRSGASAAATLEIWDEQLARVAADIVVARRALVAALREPTSDAYAAVSESTATARSLATLEYRDSLGLWRGDSDVDPDDRGALEAAMVERFARDRAAEIDRGITLTGPHRDDVELGIGGMPAKGYASHGESWSMALALKLGAWEMLKAESDEPILILDDVFAELDAGRRSKLATLVSGAEQVFVTAAVPEDVPAELQGVRIPLVPGGVAENG